MAKVVLYSTSCASTLKMKTDISRVKQLLHIKKVEYEEFDLATEPQRRLEMVAASEGVSSLPQLHLNNKYLGDWDTLQDMEDFGELDTALQAPQKQIMQDIADLRTEIQQTAKVLQLDTEFQSMGNSTCMCLLKSAVQLLQDWQHLITWQHSAGQVCQDLAWEKLHTGDWKNVSMVWRDMYSFACIVAAFVHLQQLDSSWSETDRQSTAGIKAGDMASSSGNLQNAISAAMHELDLAAIMGGPLFRPEVDQLIAAVQILHQQFLDAEPDMPPVKRQRRNDEAECTNSQPQSSTQATHLPGMMVVSKFVPSAEHMSRDTETQVQQPTDATAQHMLPPGSLEHGSQQAPAEQLPSLERFLVQYMLAPDSGQPVVVTGAMSSWPALTKWQDLRYLSRVAGPRTVPVELGKHYLADGWGQQLMLFSDFVKLHVQKEAAQPEPLSGQILANDCIKASIVGFPHGTEVSKQFQCGLAQQTSTVFPNADSLDKTNHPSPSLSHASAASSHQQHANIDKGPGATSSISHHYETSSHTETQQQSAGGGGETQHSVPSSSVPQVARGYLAQHPLFDQIPGLRNDIHEPAYCALGKGEMQSINAWFGPAGTVTPLHHDPHYNLLAQVVGTKYVRLYHPKDTASLYPYQAGLTQNSSQVDVDDPDFGAHPNFANLIATESILQPGEMLFIPPGWWHYVKALSVSFSVSFWWQ